MSEYFEAEVVEVSPVAEAQVLLTLDVPKVVWSGHIRPAQYVEFEIQGMSAWHGTIASRQGQTFFEFLVKEAGERSRRIAALKPSDPVRISAPKGEGFQVLAYRNHDLILAASGVAICAMRAVIQDILLARSDWRRVYVFYGERTADRIAFMEEQERWKESKIEVYLSVSRPAEGTYWKGHVGYVQDHLLEIAPDVRNAVAFVAGKDEMIVDFRQALQRLNMVENRILLNI